MKKLNSMFAILLIAMLLAGCGDLKDQLVGKWATYSLQGATHFEFTNDGRLIETDTSGAATNGNYVVGSDGQLTIALGSQSQKGSFMVRGDTLTLTMAGQSGTNLLREGSSVASSTATAYGMQIEQAVIDARSQTLFKVAMISANEGWGIGANGLTIHYKDGSWRKDKSPVGNSLKYIEMHDSQGWAIDDSNIMYYYKDGTWTKLTNSPIDINVSDKINSNNPISMASSAQGWATDGTGKILDYTGGKWNVIDHVDENNTDGSYNLVSATRTGEALAVSNKGEYAAYYQGGKWNSLDGPLAGETGQIFTLNLVSPNEGWVGGSFSQDGSLYGFIGQFKNGAWTDNIAITGLIWGISMNSPEEGWAVGGQAGRQDGDIEHCSNGTWTKADNIPTQMNLYDVYMVSPDEGWAVGGDGTNGIILHYQNGAWSVYGD